MKIENMKIYNAIAINQPLSASWKSQFLSFTVFEWLIWQHKGDGLW